MVFEATNLEHEGMYAVVHSPGDESSQHHSMSTRMAHYITIYRNIDMLGSKSL